MRMFDKVKPEVKEVLDTKTWDEYTEAVKKHDGLELNHKEFILLKDHTWDLAAKECGDKKYMKEFRSCLVEKLR
jgi:hypothetical protein